MSSITDFPTDVRLVIKGDYAGAQQLAQRSRNVLARALELAGKTDGGHAAVGVDYPDGTIVCQIFGDQKIVTVTVAPPPPEVPVEEPVVEFLEELPVPKPIGLLAGWIRGPTFTNTTIVAPPAPPQPRKILHDFRPIPETALAYQLVDGFQAMRRLGYSQTVSLRPGMFSGAMKRVVQAIFGIGHVGDPGEMKDVSPRYIDGSVPLGKRNVSVDYLWKWNATHGIYKAGEKNHWLVEISSLNGILAMPLILMPDTIDRGYYLSKQKKNDIGTLRVLDEFGGIPTGESFPPTGPKLEDAITKGKVLRLLGASDLDGFYGHHMPFSAAFGWAFSDSGTQAINTAMSVRDETFASFASTSDPVKPYLCSEYWQIDLELSLHDRRKPNKVPPEPVGVGQAKIKMLHIGRIDYYETLGQYWVPQFEGLVTTDTGLHHPSPWQGWDPLTPQPPSPYQSEPGPFVPDPRFPGDPQPPIKNADTTNWGAVVHAFFDGDRPERLKWVPAQGIQVGTQYSWVVGKTPPGAYHQGPCPPQYDPCAYMSAYGPYVHKVQEFGEIFSPAGFVGDSVEVRSENSAHQRFPNGDPGGIQSNVFAGGGDFVGPPNVITCEIRLGALCTGAETPRDNCDIIELAVTPVTYKPNPTVGAGSLRPDWGTPTFDESQNGHNVISTLYGVIPACCREGYIAVECLVDSFVLTTWTNPSDEACQLVDSDEEREWFRENDVCCGGYADIYYPPGGMSEAAARQRYHDQQPFSTTERSTEKRKKAVGYFTQAKRVVFEIAADKADPTVNVRWGFGANAGPTTEFVAQKAYQFPTDTAVEYFRFHLPKGLDDRAVPEKTNWIGTV